MNPLADLIVPFDAGFADYLHDESHTEGTADWIAFPHSEQEVKEVLHYAREHNLPVTMQGARTGISAGCVPNGGIVLSMVRMNHVTGCRKLGGGRYAFTCESGTVLSEFDKYVETKKFSTAGWSEPSLRSYADFLRDGEFFFTPDPTERSATLGGMAACNASGARSYAYGATRKHILALRAVLADGRTVSLQRGEQFADGRSFSLRTEDGSCVHGSLPTYTMPKVSKNTSGYYIEPDMDLLDLFIGSDGTLGVITEVTAEVLPAPHYQWCALSFFRDEDRAVSYVTAVRDAGIRPAAIEYFDGDALDILRRQRAGSAAYAALPPVPDDAGAAVSVELHDDDRSSIVSRLYRLGDLMQATGQPESDTLVARTQSDLATLRFFRHAVPESVNMLIAERKKSDPVITKLGTDMAVPDDCLRRVVRLYRDGLRETGLESAVWGHIGNNHIHVNILPRNAEDYRRGQALYREWAEAVTAMGGAVSSEHSVGKAKVAFLKIMYGPDHIAEMRALKRTFDPAELLNRGNLFGTEEES